MTSHRIPSFTLLTNDNAELLRPESRFLGPALRYTDHRFRGLFGGIWRPGRTYALELLGPCLGPEIYYSVGADEEETYALYQEPRQTVVDREAATATAAFEFARPIAEEFEGEIHLQLVRKAGDRHVLHLFLPVEKVMSRLTPAEWFVFWKQRDAEFTALQRAAAISEALSASEVPA